MDQPGLLFERHSAKIRQLSHSRPLETAGGGLRNELMSYYEVSEVHFEECRLSMSLNLYGKGGEFRLVIVGDKEVHVDVKPSLPLEERHASSSLRFDPSTMGRLACLTHFLVNLVHFMDTWHRGWKEMLDKIDEIVGFEVTVILENLPFRRLLAAQMDHTFDDRQLESYIFETSGSIDLSKQYFTTLQLLRLRDRRLTRNGSHGRNSAIFQIIIGKAQYSTSSRRPITECWVHWTNLCYRREANQCSRSGRNSETWWHSLLWRRPSNQLNVLIKRRRSRTAQSTCSPRSQSYTPL